MKRILATSIPGKVSGWQWKSYTDSGSRVEGSVGVSGCSVWGVGCRGFRVQGSGLRAEYSVEVISMAPIAGTAKRFVSLTQYSG